LDIGRGEVRLRTSGEAEPSFDPLGEVEPSPRGSGEAEFIPQGSGEAEPSSSRWVRRSWPTGVGRGGTKLPSFGQEVQ